MHFRSCVAFSAVIAVVQGVLALLAVLQHDAIFSDLLRQRISVVAQSTGSSFQSVIDLGLPISMIRNGDAIVRRPLDIDHEIQAVHAFNPSGIIVYTTMNPRPESVPIEVLRAMQRADDLAWSVESQSQIFSGYTIVRDADPVGAVVVAYPKDRLAAASHAMTLGTAWAAAAVWAAFSAVSFLLLTLLLAAPQRAIARLDALARDAGDATPGAAQEQKPLLKDVRGSGLFRQEIETLHTHLTRAAQTYREACLALTALSPSSGGAAAPSDTRHNAHPAPDDAQIAADASRSLARKIASRLAPPAAAVIVASALILGLVVLHNVNRSIEPELAARTHLIGTVVGDNVQRAVAAGVPLDKLVGAEAYFGDMLHRLPEVAYVAVATGRIILEAGQRIDPYLAPPRERKGVRSHPIFHEGEEIAYVIIDIDPAFISKRFVDVFLDMAVVILVAILAAFEVMVLLNSRSLTSGLDRLQRLAALQAAGDFSKRVKVASRGAVARLTRILAERAESLHAKFASAMAAARDSSAREALESLAARYRLSAAGPATLNISYFADIRLALFLFAAADELPLSFLPLYTRDAINLWPWLDEAILVSLPLAGYLIAITIASPFSRSLADRIGVRALFLLAAVPTFGAHLGLYFASTAQEVILWRTVTGFGYAFVTLACQDYVLGTVPREQRDRTLGMFTLVLFGGVFSGAALGGVLAHRLGQENVFLLSAALIAASALLSARFIAPDAARSETQARPPQSIDILAIMQNVRFFTLVAGVAIPANVLLQAFISYLVALSLDALGASTADIARALMLYFLGVIVVGPLAGRASEAGVPINLIALSGSILAGASLMLAAVSPSYLAIAAAVLGAGIGHGLVRGAQVSIAMTIAETELSALGPTVVLGALRTLERLGSIIGLLMIAVLAGYAGYAAATAAVAAWTLAGAALFALCIKRIELQPARGAAE